MTAVDQVKHAIDIVDLISEYVPLRKAGRNFKGLCPFHTEKTPSFVVFPETQGWHCFGACSTGGDIFSFVMKRENMTFPEALAMLAERAGIELRPLDQATLQEQDSLDRLRAVNAATAQFYHQILMEKGQGEPGRHYLEHRGVKRETMATYQLGYAPQEWHALEHELERQKFDLDTCLEAGVLSRNERGQIYDRFRGRVLFPIRDAQGRVIGFGGRTLGEDIPKYLNTPQTPLFDKSSILYGIDLARPAIRESGAAVLVEGYMDVIIPYQEGIRNLVASMGTALTEQHFRTLRRSVKTLILALDPDEAGIHAVERGAETARQHLQQEVRPVLTARGMVRYEAQLDAEVRVMALPDGLDPDELVLRDRELWFKALEDAKPVTDFLLELYAGQVDLATAKGKTTLVERMLPILAAMPSSVEQTHYLQRLAQTVRSDETAIRRDLDRHLRQARAQRQRRDRWQRERAAQEQADQAPREDPRALRPPPSSEPLEPLGLAGEDRCLALLLRFPRLLVPVEDPRLHDAGNEQISTPVAPILRPDELRNAENQQLLTGLSDLLREQPDLPTQRIAESLDSDLRPHVESLLQRLDQEPQLDAETALEDLTKSAARLRKDHLQMLIRELRFMLQGLPSDESPGSDESSSQIAQLTNTIERLTREYLAVDQSYHAATLQGRSRKEHAN